ncbi:MAG: tetratricopeptide repeat protein [Gammaproteobacteria bacterium]|nr:tetratricopeptide repeat protein [Gammaproteobacteria bacterium]
MKLIRHIMSHSILIGFVALLVLGFYYRAVLFPTNWNEQISQQVDRITGTYAPKVHAFAAPMENKSDISVAEKLATALTKESESTVASADAITEEEVTATSDSDTTELSATEENNSETPASTEVAQTEAAVSDTEQTDKEVISQEIEEVPQVASAKPATEALETKTIETKVVEAKKEEKATPTAPQLSEDKQAVSAEKTVASTDQKATPEIASGESSVTEPQKKEETTQTAASTEAAVEEKSAVTEKANGPSTAVSVAQVEETTAPATDKEALASQGSQETKDPDEITTADSSAQVTTGENQLWLQARMAYGKGDMNKALQHYQALAEQDENNPDIFGELGNIHYAQGNFQEAGNAYYEAAIRLLEQGRTGQVHYLVRVIAGLSPENADKLQQRLMNR